MYETSILFKRFKMKPGRLRSGKISNLIPFELKKQRKEMTDEKEVMRWTIKGSPASPGITEGLAVVITSYTDFKRLENDTILVCPNASPGITIVFSKIKGLVTDCGGMLASAAHIVREYGIPAVVGTSTATESIKDGDVIRVDGTNGCVSIVTRAQQHAC